MPDRTSQPGARGHITRIALLAVGVLAVLVGFITFWLPIPIGLPLLVVGSALLVRHSKTARNHAERLLQKYPTTLSWLRPLLRHRRSANRLRHQGQSVGRREGLGTFVR